MSHVTGISIMEDDYLYRGCNTDVTVNYGYISLSGNRKAKTSECRSLFRHIVKLYELRHIQLKPYSLVTIYCRSGNICTVLIFTNFERTNSQNQEYRENYYYKNATKEK